MGFYEGKGYIKDDQELGGLMTRGVTEEDVHNALLTIAEIGLNRGMAEVAETDEGLKASHVEQDLQDVLQMIKPDEFYLSRVNRLSPA